MKQRALATAVAIAALLALTGCSQNTDQNAVTQLALKDAKAHAIAGQQASAAGTWPWKAGYAVLTRTTGKNSSGPYTNWEAYGYEKSGGGAWQLIDKSMVDGQQYTPSKTPHKATCFALAGSDYGEQQQCEQLTD